MARRIAPVLLGLLAVFCSVEAVVFGFAALWLIALGVAALAVVEWRWPSA